MPTMDLEAATAALLSAGRRLGARGLIAATEGNLSIRLDRDRLLVTPSGRRKDELASDDLVLVRLGHDERAARSPSGLAPTSDLAIHLAIHAARPELGAVAHAHLPAAMALTVAGEIPDPAVLPETALFIPRVRYVPYGVMGSDELAARVAAALSPGEEVADVALLERHGAVAVAPDVATAVDRLDLLEILSRTVRDALLVRAARATLGEAAIVPPIATVDPPD
jgi:L-fuculose-phosphate aldolase